MTTLKGRGRLPKQESLLRYTNSQLVDVLGRFGQRVDLTSLRKSLKNTLDRFKGIRYAGPEVATHIRKEIERRVRWWLIDQARRNISDYRWNQLRAQGYGPDKWLRWIAVLDAGTCNSCTGRHNRVEKMKTWQLIGKPGGRQLICQSRCRCRLIGARKPRGRE